MKKKISLLLAIVMLVTLLPTAFAESKTVEATKTSQKLTLDGKDVKVGFYNISGSNYIKLRDLAAIFNGTEKKFDISYDKKNNSFIILKERDYKKVKGDLEEIKDEKAEATMSVKKVLINYNPEGSEIYQEKSAQTALINGNNYLKLRDLADLIDFGITFNKETNTIEILSNWTDKTFGGFIGDKFTKEEEKVFDAAEKFYNAIANDDKEGQYKYLKEIINQDVADEVCEEAIRQMKENLQNLNIKELKKDYKLERRLEKYADGKGYMSFFNTADSTLGINFLLPDSKESIQINYTANSGRDFTKGYADDYYTIKETELSLTDAIVFSLHSNYANKDYDAAYKNFKSLGLDGDKDKMMKSMEERTKGFDVLHPKYTYTTFKSRLINDTAITYIFNYGTKDELIMNYHSMPNYVSLDVQCRTKEDAKKVKEEVKEDKKEDTKEVKEEVKEDKKEDAKEVKEEKDTKVDKENK